MFGESSEEPGSALPQNPDPADAASASGSWPLAPAGRVVVQVTVGVDQEELIADRLFQLGASAVAQGAAVDPEEVFATAGSAARAHKGVSLVSDLDPVRVSELRSWCSRARVDAVVAVCEVDPAWPDTWRRHAVAHRVPPFLVRPPWVPATTRSGEVELVVDPGPTFGSGSHPTTRLCLSALASLVKGGESVLDVGVGSGVLAVGALVLGAASAVGIDIDPAAASTSRACAVANGVEERYLFHPGGLAPMSGPYDVVVANLLIGTIEELGGDLRRVCAPRGAVLLSGLLDRQLDRAVAAIGGRPETVLGEEGWSALVVR